MAATAELASIRARSGAIAAVPPRGGQVRHHIGPAWDLQFGELARIKAKSADVDAVNQSVSARPLEFGDHLFVWQRRQEASPIGFGEDLGEDCQAAGLGHQVERCALRFDIMSKPRDQPSRQWRAPADGR
jgi:hypothetical protein